jgi:hypothetical protein
MMDVAHFLQTINFLRAQSLCALCERYHILAKRHTQFPNLVQLKYSQIESPMADLLVQECRGLIVDEANDWNAVAYPFKKFFNQGEPNAAGIDWSTSKVHEKLDGSLGGLYRYENAWHVARSGIPDAAGPVGASFSGTFKDLFWHTWKMNNYALPDENAQRCYMFELMTPHNRIICHQSAYRLVLLGVRRIDPTFAELAPQPIAASHGWECVRTFPLATLDDCLAAAAQLNPLNAEGYVVSDSNFNRIKIKSPRYVALAHLKDGLSTRRILEIVRANESDEFLTHFPEWKGEYDRVAGAFNALCAQILADYQAIADQADRRQFAKNAQNSRAPAAVFALRDAKVRSPKEFFATCTLPLLERALGIDFFTAQSA